MYTEGLNPEAPRCIYRYALRNPCDSAREKLTDDTSIRCIVGRAME